jgi:hypothetical protein
MKHNRDEKLNAEHLRAADEQAAMKTTFASVGADVSKTKPLLNKAYKIVTAAAQRTR